jgi:tryptophanase
MTRLPPIEPFRIKVVERIRLPSLEERRAAMEHARFNLFWIPSELVYIDMLSDSGVTAMSDEQWAALMQGDEAYACSRNFRDFEDTVREIFGLPHVLPTHQGRGAEHLLSEVLVQTGMCVPNNAHFDTTRANIEHRCAEACDCPLPEALDPHCEAPFKGNMDLDQLEEKFSRHGPDNIPFVMITMTNNTMAGQPVSLQNVRDTAAICKRYGKPLVLDCSRVAENAYLIRQREPGQGHRSVRAIIRDLAAEADVCYMSCKKDGLANTGGLIAVRSDDIARRLKQLLILKEGFPTYGGLARRDLAAVAQGLREATEESYLEYRIGQVAYLAERLEQAGVPIYRPPGGHAVYIDAVAALPHVGRDQLPGQTLACEIYLEGAVRGCELGSGAFGASAKLELVRLAVPRRMYTSGHLDYVADVVGRVLKRADRLAGMELSSTNGELRHFTAQFTPMKREKLPQP